MGQDDAYQLDKVQTKDEEERDDDDSIDKKQMSHFCKFIFYIYIYIYPEKIQHVLFRFLFINLVNHYPHPSKKSK